MTRILLATHGGATANGAARIAFLLAERLHIPCETVAVIPTAPVIDGGYGPAFVPSWPQRGELALEARITVAGQLGRCGGEPVGNWMGSGAIATAFGAVAQSIADYASEDETAVLVVGEGSHHLVDRALGDETALRLAQIASVPVLAVPAHADELPRRAVAAIDFSATSERAARTAASWLAPGGTLYLAHVMPPGGAPDVADRLADLARLIDVPDGVRVEPMLLHGTPARALLEFAQRAHCDLIALGSHGYGAVKRLLLGSVASKLLRNAVQSVLVVPAGCTASPLPAPAEEAPLAASAT